jgi:type 1 fimbriae regulatory protein FimB/type 1 fimbriae regulatory protein FimE
MVHRLKGSHSGAHPLQADEAKALRALLRERETPSPILFPSRRGNPIARRTLDWLMKKYCEAADLPRPSGTSTA